jgi:hypothetical protein
MRLSANVSLLTVEATVRENLDKRIDAKSLVANNRHRQSGTTVGGILDIFNVSKLNCVLTPYGTKVKAVRTITARLSRS